MKNNDNEVFSVEELNNLNEKLKENENISLPQSLSAQKIENKLKNQTQFIPLRTEKKKINEKRLQRFIAMAASIVIVFTSLMVAKPWQDKNKPVAPTNNNTQTEDYSEIENMFADYTEKYKKAQVQNGFYTLYGSIMDGASDDKFVSQESMNMGAAPGNTATDTSSSSNHGKTNEQVQGVSEADIIKNDGKYIYVVNPNEPDWETYFEDNDTDTSPTLFYDCSISIIEPSETGELKKIGNIKISFSDTENISNSSISEIYIKGNTLIALAECSVYSDENKTNRYYSNTATVTTAICFDISDKENPKEEWRISQDGSYISSRLINDQLVLLSEYYVNINDNKETVIENCIPRYGVQSDDMQRIPCDCICIMEEINDTAYLVASTLNITDKNTLKTQTVLGGGRNVYCTTETLYVTNTEYETVNNTQEIFGVTSEKTQIYKFDIRNYDIKYSGNGSVDGYALNQFSIDEHNGYLRIATTTGNWGAGLENHLYILDKNLNIVGSINNIAKGETIKSVRFTGDTGYVVTFEQTDPLFVIDLSDPTKPEIKGELKIPGFSAYLHPVGENLVLGVGVDGDENGSGDGLKISLFDISDPKKPKETDNIILSGDDSSQIWVSYYSTAFNTHKALCWDGENQTMYIPYQRTITAYASSQHKSNYTSGILSVQVDSDNNKLINNGNYCSSSTTEYTPQGFNRTTYIDDVILGFSTQGVLSSYDKSTEKLLDSINL